MEYISVIFFGLTTLLLALMAFRLMWKGFEVMNNEPLISSKWTENKVMITKTYHPEMVDVKAGDELMVVNFGESSDESYKDLQSRIEELKEQLLEDEDDDDGDIVVRR